MGKQSAAGTTLEAQSSLPARSAVYSLLSKVFAFPGEEFHADTRAGLWTDRLSAAVRGLPYQLPAVPAGADVPSDYDAFQSEYIRLFELGDRGRAVCPLHSGHYSRDRTRTLQELIRFYNFFGLHLAEGAMPDHAAVEFEFMHYLTTAQEGSGDALRRLSVMRAQGDFIGRFLAGWWPELVERLRGQEALPFYSAAADLADQFLRQERRHLSQVVAKG